MCTILHGCIHGGPHQLRACRTNARRYDHFASAVSFSQTTGRSIGNITDIADFTCDFKSQGKRLVEWYGFGVSVDRDQIKRGLDEIDDLLIAAILGLRLQNIADRTANGALVPGYIEERLELHVERPAFKREGFGP